ncbi:MAG TPA: DMT family transporter, partial [Burkholderiales bacterium]|nr:DMT family transporter [Burkholderiales bacterium]
MLKADSARNRLTGIALVSLCYLLFTLLDGTAKWLVASVPVIVVVWLRFLMHAIFASAVLLPVRGASLVRTSHWRWHLLRALMFVLMTGINFWALQYLQLAITSSIMFIVPIVTALMAAPMLGEKIDRGRWAAIVAGFAGVLVIVRPGSA